MKRTKYFIQAALIAAIYAVMTILLAPISYGIMQVRVSEALTILPYFTPAAVPGLFIGVVIANFYGGLGLLDVIFGSLATLIAAYLSYLLRKKRYLVPAPPIIINAVIIGVVLYYTFVNTTDEASLFVIMGWVGLGQLVACYGLGYPLMVLLDKYKNNIF